MVSVGLALFSMGGCGPLSAAQKEAASEALQVRAHALCTEAEPSSQGMPIAVSQAVKALRRAKMAVPAWMDRPAESLLAVCDPSSQDIGSRLFVDACGRRLSAPPPPPSCNSVAPTTVGTQLVPGEACLQESTSYSPTAHFAAC